MRRKLSITCLFVAWLCANGTLWNMVQVAAWGKMFAGYARVMPARLALRATFDPSKPCEICTAVRQTEDASRNQPSRDAELGGGVEKILLISERVPAVVLGAPDIAWPLTVGEVGTTRVEPVPVPPPAGLTVHLRPPRRARGVVRT